MIYLDNAASTRPAPEVQEAMARAAVELFGNPSSAHGLGAAAARAVAKARETVARALGAEADDVIFTSGGTEADALGILGATGGARGRHVVVTALEHAAVRRSVDLLRSRGFEVSEVAPDRTGCVTVASVVAAARPDTALVAVMLVNNELGTIQPVADIARGLTAAGLSPHLHVDAVQAFPFLAVDVRSLGAHTVALSAHKFHGPKGVGALWIRPGTRLGPLWDGGRQERGLRSGTENVAGCVGMGVAASSCVLFREAGNAARIGELRDRLEGEITRRIAGARPTVTGGPRAPHIASMALPRLPAEPLLHALEARGVFVSAGSACSAKSKGPNPVLRAVGVDDRTAVLRFSLGRESQPEDIDSAVVALEAAVRDVAV